MPIIIHAYDNDFQLPRKTIDVIRQGLRTLLVEELQQHDGCFTSLEAGFCILRALEEAHALLQPYREELYLAYRREKEKDKYWDLRSTHNMNPLLDHALDMKGVDLDSVHGAATHILGKTAAQICNDILPSWRICTGKCPMQRSESQLSTVPDLAASETNESRCGSAKSVCSP